MTNWQIWLRRFCVVMLVWAALELVVGLLMLISIPFIPADVFTSIEQAMGMAAQDAWTSLGISAMVGSVINIVMALLGIRGAKNPCKITLFFWITLINAVLTAWALASNVSNGVIDPVSLVSGLFIIALAVCAWQVRGQTGYFDNHP